jgi:hypothetical protein
VDVAGGIAVEVAVDAASCWSAPTACAGLRVRSRIKSVNITPFTTSDTASSKATHLRSMPSIPFEINDFAAFVSGSYFDDQNILIV